MLSTHDSVRQGLVDPGAPPDPPGDLRPGPLAGAGTGDDPEVAAARGQLVDLGTRRGPNDAAHGMRVSFAVGLADGDEHRARHVRERHRAVADDKPAFEEPVADHGLLQEVSYRRV